MAAGKWKRGRDDAGSMLATVIVIVGGAGLCCFLSMLDTSSFSSWMPWMIIAGALSVIGLIVRYRYGRRSSTGLGLWYMLRRSPNDDGVAGQYQPGLIRDKRSQVSVGTNTPITAEQARELQVTSSNTWVPSRAVVREDGNSR